jgi:hypothetical protein
MLYWLERLFSTERQNGRTTVQGYRRMHSEPILKYYYPCIHLEELRKTMNTCYELDEGWGHASIKSSFSKYISGPQKYVEPRTFWTWNKSVIQCISTFFTAICRRRKVMLPERDRMLYFKSPVPIKLKKHAVNYNVFAYLKLSLILCYYYLTTHYDIK